MTERLKYILLLPLLFLTGCFPKDSYVSPLDIEITEIPYSMYDTQTWFSLSTNSVVAHNAFSDWDLGFESTGSGHHIILNTSKYMHAGRTGSYDFAGVTSNTCDTMIYDSSDGDLSKTAIGDWADFTDPLAPVFPGEVYIIDLGVDNTGLSYGTRKVSFTRFENGIYTIHFAMTDGSDEHSFELQTDPSRKFTLFSFSDGGRPAPVQPPDNEWDLCFTQYSTILFDDNNVATPYLVRGVYLNTSGTTAARDTINSYYNTRAEDLGSYTFSPSQDEIGYEWKDYKDDSYKINPGIFYLVRDQKGLYYKIRFAGFYNSSGQRGYPSFELAGLNNQ